ncbi:MAG: hypothetical protein DMF89_14670 [Acidobacteria bacterium]|nr:MAG: hypothetical protein DMF90_14790 [Acidobacteriota bacterium]PYR48763.1 MAG: hypothetical protein DMF89_14670 [Acidobacteriota bacterium]
MDRAWHRSAGILALAMMALPLAVAGVVGGQEEPRNRVGATPKGWTAPRTAWGHPDLQGVWDQTTGTPLERPKDLAGKATLSDEEAVERERRRFAAFDESGRAGGTGDYGSVWREGSKNALNRTSLVIDPPDGRLPTLTPTGQQAAAERARSRRQSPADTWEDRSLWERCITRGTPRIPNNYNSNWHILQTPQYVVIEQEMIHETRIIPLDDRPRVSSHLRQWLGEPRGRWEGATLVVESTGFDPRQEFNGLRLVNARLVERFTRTGPDTIDYRFTIDDLATYTKPFTVSLPMVRGTEYFEYACHEGNYGLAGILAGARAEDLARLKK